MFRITTRIALLIIAINIFSTHKCFAKQSVIQAVDILGKVTLSTGDEIVLADILTPKVIGIKEGYTQLFKQKSNQALVGKQVSIKESEQEYNRYNQRMAYPIMQNGQSVQDYLVSEGLALIFKTTRHNESELEALYAKEDNARKNRKGIWQSKDLQVVSHKLLEKELKKHKNRFRLVSARIIDISHKKNTTYLNTGSEWKKDTTVQIDKPAQNRSKKELYKQIESLKEKDVIIRGWIEKYNGPLIKVMNIEHVRAVNN